MQRVLAFFKHSEATQCLRRTALCFQLTGGVEALVTASRKPTEPPIAVRLVKGAADHVVRDRLSRLLGAMPLDPSLELAAATGAVLATGADLVIRMGQFKEHPSRVVNMSMRWFPESFPTNCSLFLWADAGELDVGFGLVLQRLAWQGRAAPRAAVGPPSRRVALLTLS